MLGKVQGNGCREPLTLFWTIFCFGTVFLFHIKVLVVWLKCEPLTQISLLPIPSRPHIQSLAAEQSRESDPGRCI